MRCYNAAFRGSNCRLGITERRMKMPNPIQDILRSHIKFLVELKKDIGRLHNTIHDNLALLAIEQFSNEYGHLHFQHANAGAAGIDIKGFDSQETIRLVAEVKGTLPDKNGRIRGPQTKHIEKDLQRLTDFQGDVERYLVVLARNTKEAVEDQLNTGEAYPSVRIWNALDENFVEDVGEGDA